ncbi:hypothetical protein [Zavarzinia compransoris]|uniref:Uncharacterized protein n=1 Tax=Zavarzinia compransoris TaxID=1264899 RepID=A0A317E0I5_9PROT|nr:hypothetical protein [Zavarzinia compransoris]PWR20587.1 hypothetical protein DKG75_11300 [Zavarzinia compransoris]TDP43767.1 hypothetical protein DES42_10923 [Zavarzinia compransoris]
MLGLLVKAFAILLALGLLYVTVKRAVLGSRKPGDRVEPASPPPPPKIEADDLVRCPACGTYNPADAPCATPDCRG